MKVSTLSKRMRLLSIGTNAKTVKSDRGRKYLTAILYLAPADTLAGINVCPMAEKAGCKAACLYTAGRGRLTAVQEARMRRTRWFRDDREGFMQALMEDLFLFNHWCRENGKIKPAVRLNGTSDIIWENIPVQYRSQNGTLWSSYPNLMELFPGIQFYDYTKIPTRKGLGNYHLTFSYSGKDGFQSVVQKAARNGMNLSVVYRNRETVDRLLGTHHNMGGPHDPNFYTIVDGDKDDLIFLHPPGSILALYAKGEAKKDDTGFVVDL